MKHRFAAFIICLIFLNGPNSYAMQSYLEELGRHVDENKIAYTTFFIVAAGMTYVGATSPSSAEAYCPSTLNACWRLGANPLVDVDYFQGGYNIYKVVSGCVKNMCEVGQGMSDLLSGYVSKSCNFLHNKYDFSLELVQQEGSYCSYVYGYSDDIEDQCRKLGEFVFEVLGPGPGYKG